MESFFGSAVGIGTIVLLIVAQPAWSQAYPNRPVRLVATTVGGVVSATQVNRAFAQSPWSELFPFPPSVTMRLS